MKKLKLLLFAIFILLLTNCEKDTYENSNALENNKQLEIKGISLENFKEKFQNLKKQTSYR